MVPCTRPQEAGSDVYVDGAHCTLPGTASQPCIFLPPLIMFFSWDESFLRGFSEASQTLKQIDFAGLTHQIFRHIRTHLKSSQCNLSRQPGTPVPGLPL